MGKVDVVVVGGGPAGSAVAISLARQGFEVLLFEKARSPREKPCGEYLSPGCLPILDRLGLLSAFEGLGPQPIRGWRVETAGGEVFTGGHSGKKYGVSLPRSTFDALLLQEAKRIGVKCLEGWRVLDLLRNGDGVEGVVAHSEGKSQAFSARLTIGADGRNSIVARRLRLFGVHSSHRKVAFIQRFEGVEDLNEVGEVYLGREGYCILNPQGEGRVHVGVVVDQEALPLHADWGGVFRAALGRYPKAQRRLQGGVPTSRLRVLGPLACQVKRASGDGFLLVGDAAGYYDPLTGGGIYRALRGAELASAVAAHALRNGGQSRRTFELYESFRRREFDPRGRVCQLLVWIVHHPSLCDLLIRRLRGHGEQVGELMGVVGDLLPARRLLRPGFWLRLLFCPSIDGASQRA